MLLIYPVLRPQPVTHWLLTQPVRIFMQRKAKKRMAEIQLAGREPARWSSGKKVIFCLPSLGNSSVDNYLANRAINCPGSTGQSSIWNPDIKLGLLFTQTRYTKSVTVLETPTANVSELVINSQFSLPLSIYHRCMDKAHTAQKWHS